MAWNIRSKPLSIIRAELRETGEALKLAQYDAEEFYARTNNDCHPDFVRACREVERLEGLVAKIRSEIVRRNEVAARQQAKKLAALEAQSRPKPRRGIGSY